MLEFRKESEYGKLLYGEWDVYLGNERVAKIRTPLFNSYKYLFVYYKGNEGYVKINTLRLSYDEAFEKAKNVIQKRLYKDAVKILEALKSSYI